MYTKQSIFKAKLRNIAWSIFNKLENNGNANFEKNGEKVFIENLSNYLKNSDRKRIIAFDIGANLGEYSSTLISNFLKVGLDFELHLFEPQKRCYEVLTKKFANKINIILNNFGVSNVNDKAQIFYDKEQSGLASLYQRNLKAYGLRMNRSEEIILKRMDSYIDEKNIRHIDFIKIDIEGHELKALEGFGKYLNSDFIDFLQFEYGGANLDSHTSLMELYEFFEERNFILTKIMPKGLEIRKYEPFMDNFNYSNYVAVSNRVLKQ